MKNGRSLQQVALLNCLVVPPKSCGSTAHALVPPAVPGIEQKKEEQAAQAVVPPHFTARPVLPVDLER